jgi:hypothetical protein
MENTYMARRISKRELDTRYRDRECVTGRVVDADRRRVTVAVDGWQQTLPRRVLSGTVPFAGMKVELEVDAHAPGRGPAHDTLSQLFDEVTSLFGGPAVRMGVVPAPPEKPGPAPADIEPGTLWEGRVVRRYENAVLVDFGRWGVHRVSHVYVMRAARRRYRDNELPGKGDFVAATWHGTNRDGSPRLYVWDYERDPAFRTYAAGYRHAYRGEDGLFAKLPWERRDSL